MQERTIVIGLDVGGSRLKGVALRSGGEVLGTAAAEAHAERGPTAVVERMVEAAHAACAKAGIRVENAIGLGVAAPGPMRIADGVILKSPNLPGWDDVPLRTMIGQALNKPATLLNDADAACYGEYQWGAGRGCEHLVLFTFGTGVGGGVVCNGTLVRGRFDCAGELGHMIVDPTGRRCGCGQRGCLETLAGGRYMIERAIESGLLPTDGQGGVKAIADAVVNGDERATLIWDDCCQAIAIACVNLEHALGPEKILLGGGIAEAGDILLQPVRAEFHNRRWTMTTDRPSIETAALGEYAGAIGAAGWFMHHRERELL